MLEQAANHEVRAVVIAEHGGPDVLRVEPRPRPESAPDMVLIDVKAAGVNFADVLARVGLYPPAPKPPCVVGYEVAGTVAALSEGVTELSVGQRVMAMTRFGGYCEEAIANADDVIPLPDSMSFEEGAAVPVNYVTAWLGVSRFGSVWPGERVLVHAAAGGVGIAATQIARHHGAEVFGTASPGKHDAIRGLGLDHAIDYTKRGWHRGLPRFDLVMDGIGGRSFARSYKLLRAGGRLVCFGASSLVGGERRDLLKAARAAATTPWFNVLRQMDNSRAVIGLNSLRLWDEQGSVGPYLQRIRELIDKGVVKPVVAEAFSFDDAASAHRYIGERKNIGKVVLTP